MKVPAIFVPLIFITAFSTAQIIPLAKDNLEASKVIMTLQTLMGKNAVRIEKDPSVKEFDEATFVKLKGVELKDGVIEVSVLSKLLPNAPETARGFIGVAFRISSDNSKFESLYIRPTNGRALDQIRRNHSTQYFSYPDYKFDRLRKEAPEKYESYVDIGLNEWIKMKIVFSGAQAMLFINDNKEPSLIVNDLKHGAAVSGGVGLWVETGTEGYFADVKVGNR